MSNDIVTHYTARCVYQDGSVYEGIYDFVAPVTRMAALEILSLKEKITNSNGTQKYRYSL